MDDDKAHDLAAIVAIAFCTCAWMAVAGWVASW